MKRVTREEILAAALATEVVPVPEWGGEVVVRELTGAQRDAYEESCFTGRGRDRRENFRNLRARLVALAVVDEAGAPLFSETDVEALGNAGAAALDRVFTVAQRLSGLSAKDVEDLAGNSEPGPSAATTSG